MVSGTSLMQHQAHKIASKNAPVGRSTRNKVLGRVLGIVCADADGLIVYSI